VSGNKRREIDTKKRKRRDTWKGASVEGVDRGVTFLRGGKVDNKKRDHAQEHRPRRQRNGCSLVCSERGRSVNFLNKKEGKGEGQIYHPKGTINARGGKDGPGRLQLGRTRSRAGLEAASLSADSGGEELLNRSAGNTTLGKSKDRRQSIYLKEGEMEDLQEQRG